MICHYKYARLNGKLKDECLIIPKGKHVTTKTNKKKRIMYNMNSIMQMVCAKSYDLSFKRFIETDLVHITADTKKFSVRLDYKNDNDNKLFVVEDIYNPYVYLMAYEDGKKLNKCVICGKHFIKTHNNQKTCGDKCSELLKHFNIEKTNERNRNAV